MSACTDFDFDMFCASTFLKKTFFNISRKTVMPPPFQLFIRNFTSEPHHNHFLFPKFLCESIYLLISSNLVYAGEI